MKENLDRRTVESFGDEWSRFDQSELPESEARAMFSEYFAVFPWERLPVDAVGFDMGCGTGRWARYVAPRVGRLHCIDPSVAIECARSNLNGLHNIEFHRATVDQPGLVPGSQDFGYSLGVLHHIPDPAAGIRSCVALLKPGAPLLLYLYYAFDNRPWWFRGLWRLSDRWRRVVYRLPPKLKHATTDIVAAVVYWPLSRVSSVLEGLGFPVADIPLSYYRRHSFYTMRTDARDRFGTPLEFRFTQAQIETMMRRSGLVDIRFSNDAPFWCVVGVKASSSCAV